MGARLIGYREFQRACRFAEKDTRREVRAAFKKIGEVVRVEWARRFSRVDAHSAAGYRVGVQQRGVFVTQSLRRTTGRHPEFGALQMRYGLRTRSDKEREIEHEIENAIDRVADHFERRN